MINISMNPDLVTIGSFTVAWHGVMVGLAVVAAVYILARNAKGSKVAMDDIYTAALWAVVGGIIGARVSHVIDHWNDIYRYNFWQVFRFWEGGLGLWGALVGGFIFGGIYCLVRKLPVGKLADLAAPGVLVAQAIGRVGCTINGDAYGTPTSLPWGVYYTNPNDAATTIIGLPARHPTPVYEILYDLFLFAIIWRFRKRFKHDWMVFLVWAFTYALGRFFLSFVRGDEAPVLGSLHQAQVIALGIMVVTLPLFIWLSRRPAPEPVATSASAQEQQPPTA